MPIKSLACFQANRVLRSHGCRRCQRPARRDTRRGARKRRANREFSACPCLPGLADATGATLKKLLSYCGERRNGSAGALRGGRRSREPPDLKNKNDQMEMNWAINAIDGHALAISEGRGPGKVSIGLLELTPQTRARDRCTGNERWGTWLG